MIDGRGTDLPVRPQMMVFLPGGMFRVTSRRAGVSLLVVVSQNFDWSRRKGDEVGKLTRTKQSLAQS